MIRYFEAYGYCESHHTKHIATISTGHTSFIEKTNIDQLHDALKSDLIEEFPWCYERGMKIKVTDVTSKILAGAAK
jgi:hypothetical protein